MDFENSYVMTIAGADAHGSGTVDVVDPATGRAFASAPRATKTDLDHAVAAAKAALPAWQALSHAERAATLGEAAKVIDGHADALAALFVREQGRPFAMAKAEIQFAAYWLKMTAKLDLPVEVIEELPAYRVEIHHDPLGVVGAIVPWNFPVLTAIGKIAPAVLTGNTLVLKPSPFTPLCTLKIGELLRTVFPAGVVNVITGADDLGPMMTSHPGFAKISFTGSTATGKRILESAARDLKRVTLELGGNDAAIVMGDVDVDAIAEQIFSGAFYNSAQTCVATKRLYLHDDIYDAMRDRLHAIAREKVVGNGADRGSDYGPIQNELQYRRVMALMDDARASGLTLLEGREVPGEGFFVPLTLVDNPPEDSRVVVEEAFGPILPLMRFSDVDDVIARANDTHYGLAGAVWSKDEEQAIAIARRLETGIVWVNDNLQNYPNIPFGGAKQSGFGVENGRAGLKEYTQPKSIYLRKRQPAAA